MDLLRVGDAQLAAAEEGGGVAEVAAGRTPERHEQRVGAHRADAGPQRREVAARPRQRVLRDGAVEGAVADESPHEAHPLLPAEVVGTVADAIRDLAVRRQRIHHLRQRVAPHHDLRLGSDPPRELDHVRRLPQGVPVHLEPEHVVAAP